MDAKAKTHPLVALDILRGLAAFEVMLTHTRASSFVEYGLFPASQHNPLTFATFSMMRLGRESVLIFFVLSGFLVGGQIISRLSRGTFDLRFYAIDRATRIFLPLIPACLFAATIAAITGVEPLHLGALLGNMVGLNEILVPTLRGDPPLWTLAFEIWFYITGGAVGYLIARSKGGPHVAALLVLALCLLVFSVLPARYLFYWTLGAAATWCLGCRFKEILALGGFLVLAAGFLSFQLAIAPYGFAGLAVVSKDLAESLICLGLFFMLPLLCSSAVNQRLAPLRRIAGAISGFSYSLYLFHVPTNLILDTVFPQAGQISSQSLLHFGLRLAACVLVSAAAYWLFERNTPKLRRALAAALDRRPKPLAAGLQPAPGE